MKRLLKIVMVFVFLLSVNYSFAAAVTSDDILGRVNELNSQLNKLNKDQTAAEAKDAALAQEEKRLIATSELLEGAVANYNKDLNTHNAEAADQNAQVSYHNSVCEGTFEDENFVNSCNAEATRLNEWGSRISDHAVTLDMHAAGLRERINDLNNGTFDWIKRTKENNAVLNDIYAQQYALTERINQLLASLSFRDLVEQNGLSQECSTISEQITSDDVFSPNLNTAMEQAHNCLQRVWDGAR